MMAAKAQQRIHINTNTIIGGFTAIAVSVIGGILIWLVTSSIQHSRDSAKEGSTQLQAMKSSVDTIKIELPHVTSDVSEVKTSVKQVEHSVGELKMSVAEVKNAQAISEKSEVSKDDFIKNQQRTEELINSVRTEQSRTREELTRKKP